MKTLIHMSINLQGILNHFKGRKINILEDDNGNILTDQQARIHIHNLQIQGHKLMGSSKCEGFDPFGGGCPGHEIMEEK